MGDSDDSSQEKALVMLSHMIEPYPRMFKTGEQIQEKPPISQIDR